MLRFESAKLPAGETLTLPEYANNMKAGQRDIYYLAAPSRQLAESSPYFEALKKKDVEILFCYEPYDELVLMQLQQFDKKKLTSVEKEMRQSAEDAPDDTETGGEDGAQANIKDADHQGLAEKDAMDLTNWFQAQLGTKVCLQLS